MNSRLSRLVLSALTASIASGSYMATDAAIQSPWTQAELAGEAYLKLNDYTAASASFQKALSLCNVPYPSPFRQISTLKRLSWISLQTRKYDDAEKYAGQAVTLAEKFSAGPLLADCLFVLANAYVGQHQLKKALPVFDRVIAIRERFPGPRKRALLAWSLYEKANVLMLLNDPAGAEPLYARALKAVHDGIPQMIEKLATCCFLQKKYDQSEQLYKHALVATLRAYPKDRIAPAYQLQLLAVFYGLRQDYPQGTRSLKRSLELLVADKETERSLSTWSVGNAIYRQWPAVEPAHIQATIEVFDRLIQELESEPNPDRSLLAWTWQLLGAYCLDQRQYDRSVKALSKSLTLTQQLPDASWRLASIEKSLAYARALQKAGNAQEHK